MFDKTTEDCKLFSSPLNDLWNDCREVGYAREPDHELCDEMFPSDSSNGCYVSICKVNYMSIHFPLAYLLLNLSLTYFLLLFIDRTLEKITVDMNSAC